MKAKALIFATHNAHKVQEVKDLMPEQFQVLSLDDINFTGEIHETGTTLAQNALSKAYYLYKALGKNCFSDDSGLVVDALNGEPGVYSARYAVDERNDQANLQKVLDNLKDKTDRKASFKTVFYLIWNGTKWLFEGEVEGTITEAPRGTNGFGYDPIFLPVGHSKTFGEMSKEEKGQISHRAIALKKMIHFLSEQNHIISFQEDDYLVKPRTVVQKLEYPLPK
ncbi:MAG: RdgB/HAM1 family non-canonical purine NTP pyrophosphatase [Bacteroidia bacterium]